jgi:hypothetical protein
MRVIKLYRKPDKPEFFKLVRVDSNGDMLLNYPIGVPDSKRVAVWITPNNVRVEWIKEFTDGDALQGT